MSVIAPAPGEVSVRQGTLASILDLLTLVGVL